MLGKSDEGEHARLRRLVYEFFKTFEINWPGRARIDRRGHSSACAQRVQFAPVGVYTPVTMHVKVDKPRCHVAAGDVENSLCIRARNNRGDGGDAIAGDADIENLV